jgi:hypothetical protein
VDMDVDVDMDAVGDPKVDPRTAKTLSAKSR